MKRQSLYADLLLADLNIVDVISSEIYSGAIAVKGEKILGVGKVEHLVGSKTVTHDFSGFYALPGFMDAHIHIESSMLTLTEFAKAVVPHGTTATVSDPHEVANVLGSRGVKLLLEEAKGLPLKAFFTAPSCVPAAPGLGTSGAQLDAKEVEDLLKNDRVVGLGEVMNFPGVINGDPQLLEKIRMAHSLGKAVDGHAPQLRGGALRAYVNAGVQSDHECTTGEEALEKHGLGMWIMIREGSASKDLRKVFQPFLHRGAPKDRLMLVSDDLNPVNLMKGHLDNLVRMAVEEGLDPLAALRMVTINPALYFHLDPKMGSLSAGKEADIIILEDLENMKVGAVFINGRLVAKDGKLVVGIQKFSYPPFSVKTVKIKAPPTPESFAIPAPFKKGLAKVRVIVAKDASLLTQAAIETVQVEDFRVLPDPARDLLQVAVVERHGQTGNIGKGFVRGFGLREGALASTVAHDSHNLIVVGTKWVEMAAAVQVVCAMDGGMVAIKDGKTAARLPLPVAGLMSQENANAVIDGLQGLHKAAKELGCTLQEPFMTLSFLALPVIPELKVTDKGLVDVKNMRIIRPLIDDPKDAKLGAGCLIE